jgi:hypothetical protein
MKGNGPMPLYDVQQYETHITTIRVTADSPAGAVTKVFNGEGTVNNFEFAGIADDHGMPINEDQDLADQLLDLGVIKPNDEIIPSIRGVKEVVDEGDEDE